MMKTRVWVTISIEGVHSFTRAGTDPAFADVRYLANQHRHEFRFRVAMEVLHDDRDIEFHQFRRWLRGRFGPEPVDFGTRSCETIAAELHAKIAAAYPGRAMTIDVSEDGECGATIERDAAGDSTL